MEYAQPFIAPVLLVYALLGALIAFARIRAETGLWTEVHVAPTGDAPSGLTVHQALMEHDIPCKLRSSRAQLSSGPAEPVTVASVRPHHAPEAQRIIHRLQSSPDQPSS